MLEDWTIYSWYCPNCKTQVAGLKNKKNQIRVICTKCSAEMVRTVVGRRHDVIDIYAPIGMEHEWKDKVFHRAVEGAGCIYCEKAFLKELPYLLVTMYAKQYGLAARTDDEKLIGARIDAVIPELRLAFAFSQKGTDREAKVAEVLHFLCKAKRIQLFVIRQKDPIALATEIKQAFAKANLFINSDSQRDVAHLRKRYFAQKNDGN